MTDLTPFERRLAERIAREFDSPVPFDAGSIARAAMVRRGVADLDANRLAFGPISRVWTARRLTVIAIIALLLVATLVAVGLGWALRPTLLEPRLMLVNGAGELVAANPDGSAPTFFARSTAVGGTGDALPFNAVLWAPGGRHLAAVENFGSGNNLVIFGRDGSVVSTTTFSDHGALAWSADGQRIAVLDGAETPQGLFMQRVRLRILDLDGQVSWTVRLPAGFEFAVGLPNLAWAPGPAIAVTGAATSGPNEGVGDLGLADSFLWLADPASSEFRQLTFDDVLFDYAPTWTHDGRLLFARHRIGEDDVWQADVTGVIAPLFAWSSPLAKILPAPSGSDVVVLADWYDRWRRAAAPIRLAIVDPDSGAVKDLIPTGSAGIVAASYGSAASWSADRNSVLFLEAGITWPPDLKAVEIETGSVSSLGIGASAFDVSQPSP